MTGITFRSLAAATVLTAALAGGLVACGSTQARADAGAPLNVESGIEVVAVAMKADWCGACKQLEPKVMEAMDQVDGLPVKLVGADYTDRKNPATKSTLSGLGLDNLEASNGGKTGLIYLVDADTGEVLDTIRNDKSAAQIAEAMRQAVAAAS